MTRPHSLIFLMILPVLACDGDVVISNINSPPVAEILSPGDDAAPFQLGDTIAFDGLVEDKQDAPRALVATWVSNIDGTLYEDVPSSTGWVEFATNTLSEGSHVITLQAMDSAGEFAEDYVTIQITRSNDGPTVQIEHPGNGDIFEQGALVTFTAVAADPDEEDTPDSLSAVWQSDLDGMLCNDPPDASGALRCDAAALSLGMHIISVAVNDDLGVEGSDQVVVVIEEPDEPPLAAIRAPTSGESLLNTVAYFQAEVSDDVDRADELSLEWSSDVDGVFNWDPASSSGFVEFTTWLSVGDHEITLTVTDSKGQTAQDLIQITALDGGDWDTDGDGYTPNQNDCDDGDAAVHPGVPEICDGIDNDCDGTVDNNNATDALTWYRDQDGDSYGDGTSSTTACTQPTGYVSDASDCDDASATSSPAGTEICNGADDDCDGVVDEDDAADALTWYRDADSDGYGNPAVAAVACSQPSGFVGTAAATDCDDGDASAYPGATEYCDGVDNDCDGTVDPPSSVDASTWYRDGDADRYGVDGATTVDCSAPSGYAANGGDCDDGDSSVNPGATESCNDVDDDCDGDINEGLGDGYEANDSYPGTDLGNMDGDGYCIYYYGYISGSADVQSISGTIHEPNDVDYYLFETTDDVIDCLDETGYGIQVTLSSIPSGHDYVLELWHVDTGALVASSDNAGSTSESLSYTGTYSFTSDSDDGGEYAVVVYANPGSGYGCSSYNLSVTVW